MKNRNSQFTKVLLIALLAGVAVFSSTAATQAAEAPFNGSVSGIIPADLGPPVPGSEGCVFSFIVENFGRATLLRDFTGTANFIPNLCDGSYFGTFTLGLVTRRLDLRPFRWATRFRRMKREYSTIPRSLS